MLLYLLYNDIFAHYISVMSYTVTSQHNILCVAYIRMLTKDWIFRCLSIAQLRVI